MDMMDDEQALRATALGLAIRWCAGTDAPVGNITAAAEVFTDFIRDGSQPMV